MNNEERLIEIMAELLAEVHEMRVDTAKQFTELNQKAGKLEEEIVNIKEEMFKMNLQLASNTRAVMQMADNIQLIPAIIERLTKLEIEVFKKAS